MNKYNYVFPPTKFSRDIICGNVTRAGQADEIAEEAAEVIRTVQDNESDERYIEELLDVVQACETALREFDPYRVEIIRRNVMTKNDARGYYGDPGESVKYWDAVNHPSHYPSGSIEIIESVVHGLPAEKAVALANVLKYVIRAGHKEGETLESDLAKANNYAHRLVTGSWRWE